MLYLVSKYGYGLVIRSFSPYASSTMQLLPAMVIISLIMLPRVHIRELIKQCNGDSGRKGSNYVSAENNGQKTAQTRNENPVRSTLAYFSFRFALVSNYWFHLSSVSGKLHCLLHVPLVILHRF